MSSYKWQEVTVRQYDSEIVRQRESTTARQYDSEIVRQWDSTAVRQWDSTAVRQYGSETVRQWDSETVQQWDSETVRQRDSTTVVLWQWYYDSDTTARWTEQKTRVNQRMQQLLDTSAWYKHWPVQRETRGAAGAVELLHGRTISIVYQYLIQVCCAHDLDLNPALARTDNSRQNLH